MKTLAPALILLTLSGCVTNKENSNLPKEWEFMWAMAFHVDTDPDTGLSRANCFKIRRYRAEPTSNDYAFIRYEQFNGEGWLRKSATLRRENDEWVWQDGDEPRCNIYFLG
ncbi:MAG: hypothetical protein ABJ311_09985 [Erythrobacter sp.]